MTAPQPDTETLVATVRTGLNVGPLPEIQKEHEQLDAAHDALDALAVRLAETEAQRDEVLRNIQDERVQAQLARGRETKAWARVATLEAALEWAVGEQNLGALIPDRAAYEWWRRRVREMAALDSLPSQPVSLTAEDAAYVARRATWECE